MLDELRLEEDAWDIIHRHGRRLEDVRQEGVGAFPAMNFSTLNVSAQDVDYPISKAPDMSSSRFHTVYRPISSLQFLTDAKPKVQPQLMWEDEDDIVESQELESVETRESASKNCENVGVNIAVPEYFWSLEAREESRTITETTSFLVKPEASAVKPSSATSHDTQAGQIVSKDNPNFTGWANELTINHGADATQQTLNDSDTNALNAVSNGETRYGGYKIPRILQEERAGVVRHQEREHQYLGDTNSKAFRRIVDGLQDDLNCSLFVKNLPIDVKIADLTAIITTGALVSLSIRLALPPKHLLPAAGISFKQPEAAAEFMAQVRSRAGLSLCGIKIKARDISYNYHGMMAFPEDSKKTRVLLITGPSRFMNWEHWKSYFDSCAKYQISHKAFRAGRDAKQGELEVGFARIDGQAESIHLAIRKE